MTIETLLHRLQQGIPTILAIDGPSGSGKTTIANELADRFHATLVRTDDYFLPAVRKTPERLAEPGGNLDYERMEDEIFHRLNDVAIVSRHFNCMTEALEQRDPIKRQPIVIVEGVYSMHPRFQKYYDVTLFLDVDPHEQLRRIEMRSGTSMLERFKREWIPLENQYFAFFAIRDLVDIYVSDISKFRESM